jgi:hypothetical protein
MADVTGIPRWLELAAEIDYRIFLLNEMRRQLEAEDERLTPLDRLIDEAAGLDAARLAEATEIIAELKVLKAEWDALVQGEHEIPLDRAEVTAMLEGARERLDDDLHPDSRAGIEARLQSPVDSGDEGSEDD